MGKYSIVVKRLMRKRGRVFNLRLHLCFQLKEMCRRELDKSESEIKKNGSIIGEYKQVNTHTDSHTQCVSSEHGLLFLFEIALILMAFYHYNEVQYPSIGCIKP